MFQPKRTKYRKQMKGRNRGLAQRSNSLDFGTFGLKATSRGQITSRQIEAARRAMTRHVKRGAKIWIRIFPDVPVTKKPAEVRQGKGKGAVGITVTNAGKDYVVLLTYDGYSEVSYNGTVDVP